jgi:hypothetical protein
MKRTELSSSAVHFVTERANTQMERGWRAEERQLLKVTKRSETLTPAGFFSGAVAIDQILQERVKENEQQGLESFRQSRAPQTDPVSTLTDTAITSYEHDLFICHVPTKVGGVAKALKVVFQREHGHTSLVIPDDSATGWGIERILSAIRTAEVFCLFVSEGAMDSHAVQLQLREAFREHKYIFMVHDYKLEIEALTSKEERDKKFTIRNEGGKPLLTNGQLDWLFTSLRSQPVQKGNYKFLSQQADEGISKAKMQHKQDAASAKRSKNSTVMSVRRQVRPDEANWQTTESCKRPPIHLAGMTAADEWQKDDSHTSEEEASTYETCLDRAYVQQEIRWAKKYKKDIITVFEREERRAGFFDYAKAWERYRGGEWEHLLRIDAISYQRDEFQAEAMLKNIYAKSDRHRRPPPIPKAKRKNDPGCWDFFLSHAQVTASDQAMMTRMRLVQDGKAVWYDNAMLDKSDAAMEEGVKQCACFVLFLTSTPKVNNVAQESQLSNKNVADAMQELQSLQELKHQELVLKIEEAVDNAFTSPHQAALQERERCITMLRELGDTIALEFSRSKASGHHWGSEDGRTKLWFIALTRPRIYFFILVVVIQVAVTAIRAAVIFQG